MSSVPARQSPVPVCAATAQVRPLRAHAGIGAGDGPRVNDLAGAAGQSTSPASADLSPGAAADVIVSPGATVTTTVEATAGAAVTGPMASSAANGANGLSTSASAAGAGVSAAASNAITAGTVLSGAGVASTGALPNTALAGNGTSRSGQAGQTALHAGQPDAHPDGAASASEVASAATGGSAAQGEDLSGQSEGSPQGQEPGSAASSLINTARVPDTGRMPGTDKVGRSTDGASTEAKGASSNGSGSVVGAGAAGLAGTEARPTLAIRSSGAGADLGTGRPGGSEQGAPGQLGTGPAVAGQVAGGQSGPVQAGPGAGANGAQVTVAAIAPGPSLAGTGVDRGNFVGRATGGPGGDSEGLAGRRPARHRPGTGRSPA